MWTQLDSEEALAYEDKLAAQVHVLEEATASLRQLQALRSSRIEQPWP